MMPRAPLLSVAAPEKIQPVKWHFSRGRLGRSGREGARRLPPLQSESSGQAGGQAEKSASDEEPAVARSLSPHHSQQTLDLCWKLYGGDVAPLRRCGAPRRRPGPGNRSSADVHAIATGSELLPAPMQSSSRTSQQVDELADWDDICSVEALESAGSGKELWLDDDEPEDENGLAVSQLMDTVLLQSRGIQGISAVCSPQAVTSGTEDASVAAPQHPSFSRSPPPPARLRASPSASSLPNRGGLPAATSADWAVAKVIQAYGHHSLPVPVGQQALPALMPTLDDLLGLKGSRRLSGRRQPRLSSPRMPHTAR